MKYKLSEIAIFNPKENLPKGTKAKKVSMEALRPFYRDISSFSIEPYNGGSKFRNGDTIMARITPCLENGKTAKVGILDKGEIGYGSTEFIVFRAIKGSCDPDFLYYLVCSPLVRDPAIKSMVGSSGRQRVQTDVLEQLIIDVPALECQKQIGYILKSIDDKIELNNKINKNLEEQQSLLFQENLLKNSYSTATLGSLATIKYGKGLPTKKLVNIGYPVFGGNGIIGKYNSYMYKQPQVLVSCRGAASGKILESYPKSYITNNSLILEWHDYRYYEFFKQYFIANQLYLYATGSAQPQITIDNIKDVPVPYPPYHEIDSLCSELSSLSLLHYQNIIENEQLATLRDFLLPRLMSGELDVSDLDL